LCGKIFFKTTEIRQWVKGVGEGVRV